MLVQSIHYTFAPEHADAVAASFAELRDASLREPGVVSFRVARSNEKPNVFLLWEEYRDEAALEAHAATAHFKRLVIDEIRKLAKERIGEKGSPLP